MCLTLYRRSTPINFTANLEIGGRKINVWGLSKHQNTCRFHVAHVHSKLHELAGRNLGQVGIGDGKPSALIGQAFAIHFLEGRWNGRLWAATGSI